jgi:hypothetical protein
MSGLLSAAAICIAPVSPPITSFEFFKICAVSCKVVFPQKDVIAPLGFEEISMDAKGIESCPPTNTTWIFCEENSLQISIRVDSGMTFPICAAPSAIVM